MSKDALVISTLLAILLTILGVDGSVRVYKVEKKLEEEKQKNIELSERIARQDSLIIEQSRALISLWGEEDNGRLMRE